MRLVRHLIFKEVELKTGMTGGFELRILKIAKSTGCFVTTNLQLRLELGGVFPFSASLSLKVLEM